MDHSSIGVPHTQGAEAWITVVSGYLTLKVLRHGSQFYIPAIKLMPVFVVSVHQMASPQTEVADI